MEKIPLSPPPSGKPKSTIPRPALLLLVSALLLFTPPPSFPFNFSRTATSQPVSSFGGLSTPSPHTPTHGGSPSSPVWTACGNSFAFECTTVWVPMNHNDLSDERSFGVAVTKLPARDKENKKGTIFFNPGGPGGSGTAFVQNRGEALMNVIEGKYDLIGFDPRGINLTSPAINCFPNLLQHSLLNIATPSLSLPANLSLLEMGKLELDLERNRAGYKALDARCIEGMGEWIKWVSTWSVVKDIDWMSRAVGDEKVNYWGFSYGTIVGQYLLTMLEPSRIGKVIIDGVVDPELWIDYGDMEMEDGLDDIDNVFSSFASTCLDPGSSCALSSHFSSPQSILDAIDKLIDNLYLHPQPLTNLSVPSLLVDASDIRGFIFSMSYRIGGWKEAAENLEKALFKNDFSGIVARNIVNVTELARESTKPDNSAASGLAITCADSKPYLPNKVPFPSSKEYAKHLVKTLERFSTRAGEGFLDGSFCDVWEELGLKFGERWEGPFELEEGTLDFPALVMSQHFDPVTPLIAAKEALRRMGGNVRLVEQVDGYGHCTINQASYCTAKLLRDYWSNDVAPSDPYTRCKVDQKPFQDWNATLSDLIASNSFGGEAVDVELIQSWWKLGEETSDEDGAKVRVGGRKWSPWA